MPMPITCIPLDIPEVLLLEPAVFADDRGRFCETYKRSDFQEIEIEDLAVETGSRGANQIHAREIGSSGRVVLCEHGPASAADAVAYGQKREQTERQKEESRHLSVRPPRADLG